MTKTWLGVVTALCVVGLSVTWFVVRLCTQGPEAHGPAGEQAWRVTAVAAGELAAKEVSLVQSLPPDFRHQHILDERFHSPELTHRQTRAKPPTRRELVWHRAAHSRPSTIHLSYSFRCVTGVRRPSRIMARLTALLDAPPSENAVTRPSPRIESESKEIARQARELATEEMTAEEEARTLFAFVDALANRQIGTPLSALECLRAGGGAPADKSRLLIALLRNRDIPSRLVQGIILDADVQQRLHAWVEAWIENHWVPMCPANHHFGGRDWPSNSLVLLLGEEELLRTTGSPLHFSFTIQSLRDAQDDEAPRTPAFLRKFWRTVSLYGLRPTEQHVVKFLLLLPLAALIVTLYRTVIGIETYGTFGPALLGLAFLDLKALHWGLLIFVLTVMAGWGMRHLLDRFHLLMVPRTAALLTLIIMFLIAMILIASDQGISATQYISLFPLVILTHLVERFWTLENEDSTRTAFRTLLGTLVVAVTVSLALTPDVVSAWLFRYPETLGLVLAAEILLGRYTGYRLTELYRFQDLIQGQ